MNKSSVKDGLSAWMDNAGRLPLLSASETRSLADRIQSLEEGDPKRSKLVNKLVSHNLRLVVFSVKGFMSAVASPRKWGCPETVDHLQAGTIGLIRAAELYDPSKGYTFATYANHWIRSKVSRYSIKTRSLVHVSESMSRNIISYKRNGFLRARGKGEILAEEKILPILREAEAALSCASLNVKNEYGHEMLESIPDPLRQDVEYDLSDDVDTALNAAGISGIGKEILMLSFGHGCSKREIASRLGITVDMVRKHTQIALHRAKRSKELASMV
jgi:RNA polymerase primary sigma factor